MTLDTLCKWLRLCRCQLEMHLKFWIIREDLSGKWALFTRDCQTQYWLQRFSHTQNIFDSTTCTQSREMVLLWGWARCTGSILYTLFCRLAWSFEEVVERSNCVRGFGRAVEATQYYIIRTVGWGEESLGKYQSNNHFSKLHFFLEMLSIAPPFHDLKDGIE